MISDRTAQLLIDLDLSFLQIFESFFVSLKYDDDHDVLLDAARSVLSGGHGQPRDAA